MIDPGTCQEGRNKCSIGKYEKKEMRSKKKKNIDKLRQISLLQISNAWKGLNAYPKNPSVESSPACARMASPPGCSST